MAELADVQTEEADLQHEIKTLRHEYDQRTAGLKGKKVQLRKQVNETRIGSFLPEAQRERATRDILRERIMVSRSVLATSY